MKTIRTSLFERGISNFTDLSTTSSQGEGSSCLMDYNDDGLPLPEIYSIAVDSVFSSLAVPVSEDTGQKDDVVDCNNNNNNNKAVNETAPSDTKQYISAESKQSNLVDNVVTRDVERDTTTSGDINDTSESADDSSDVGAEERLKVEPDTYSETGRPLRSCRGYNFRASSISKRIETEVATSKTKTTKPHKVKPPPLSKYRRKTANTRERERMQEVNDAFDKLRHSIPSARAMQKLTKITTLKMALTYIDSLQQILGYDDKYRSRLSSVDNGGGNSDGFASCSSDTGSMSPVHSPPMHTPIIRSPSGSEGELSHSKWGGS